MNIRRRDGEEMMEEKGGERFYGVERETRVGMGRFLFDYLKKEKK